MTRLRMTFLGMIFAVTTSAWYSAAPLAQVQTKDISSNAHSAIQQLGFELNSEDLLVRLVLGQLGFPPTNAPSTWLGWQKWPSVRMLELAYVSAEAAQPGSGGMSVLRKVVRVLAANHIEAIRYAPEVSHFFHEPNGVPISEKVERVAFSIPAPQQMTERLPPEARSIIRSISRHTESVPRIWLLGRCCGLTEDEVYETMRGSESDAQAIEKAVLLKAPPPSVGSKVATLIDTAQQANHAITLEPVLHDLRLGDRGYHPTPMTVAEADLSGADKRLGDSVTSALAPMLPKPPGPAVVPPGAPVQAASKVVASSYQAFERSRYPSSGGLKWSFRRMSRLVFGFGGVILGNDVEADGNVQTPIRVSWIPGPVASSPVTPTTREAWGRLIFTFKDGTSSLSRMLRADSVLAAAHLAFQTPHTSGDGLGLVGFTNRFSNAAITAGSWKAVGRGYSFVVHPQVADTRLGRALMLLDTLPMPEVRNLLIRQVRSSGASDIQVKTLEKVLHSDLGQYKFVDVSLVVTRSNDGQISVERKYDSGYSFINWLLKYFELQNDAENRQRAFITMLTFDGQTPRDEDIIPIYSLIPMLVEVAEPFARANEFAECFALLRWAQSSGAAWTGKMPPSPDLPISTALVIGGDGSIKYGASEAAFTESMVLQADQLARFLAKSTKSAALENKTDVLTQKYSEAVSLGAALHVAGDAFHILALRFSSDPELAKRYPEVATKVADLEIFSESRNEDHLAAQQKREEAYEWLHKHTELLEQVAPGIRERALLGDRYLKIANNVIHEELNPNILMSDIAHTSHSELETLAKRLREMDKNKARAELVNYMDQALPGLGKWYQFELSTLKIVWNLPE